MACIFLAALDQVFIPLSRSPHRQRITSNRPLLLRHYPLSSNILVRIKITVGSAGIYVIPFLSSIPSPTPVNAYLLAASALSPLYGKLSDIIGRKPVLYSAILIFLVSCQQLYPFSFRRHQVNMGSALCGAAQGLTWPIICRAVQGIGGGGIIQLVQITISDIVSLQE